MATIKMARAKLIGTVVEYKENKDQVRIHWVVEIQDKRYDIEHSTSKGIVRGSTSDFVTLNLYKGAHLNILRKALYSIGERFYPDGLVTDDVIEDVKGNLKDLYKAILERTEDFKFEPTKQ